MRYFAVFDIGGTAIKHGIVNEEGTILERYEMPTEAQKGPEIWLENIVKKVEEFKTRYTLSGIALSSTAMIDADKGRVVFARPETMPGYTGFDVKGFLQARCGLTVEVENDVNCVALAESISGAGKGYDSVLSLAIGTGVGGGFTEKGKLLRGNTYSACEAGYVRVSGGDFEHLGSTGALVRRVEAAKHAEKGTWNGYLIEKAAKEGDEDCIKSFEVMVNAIAEGLETFSYILNPACIVLGGGIMKMEGLVDRIRARYSELINPLIGEKTVISKAMYENEAGMLGAFYHFQEKHPEL